MNHAQLKGPARHQPVAGLRSHLRLMVITDRGRSRGRTEVDVCRQALRGGATAVQLRAKDDGDGALLRVARQVAAMAARSGALFLVNDRPDIAALSRAGGCHLGPDDLGVEQARQVAGDRLILGFSAGTVAAARQAEGQGADYLGVGPVFPTDTKSDAGAPLGLAGLEAIVHATSLPVVAVGGIDAASIASCIEAGACGAAVITAAVGAASIAPAVRRLRRLVDAALERRPG